MKSKRLRSKRAKTLLDPSTSTFSKLDFWTIIVAVLIQAYLGFRHIGDADAFGRKFGWMTLLEAGLGLGGLLFTDIVRGHKFPPTNYREIETKTGGRFLVIFILIVLVQVVFFAVPLTVRDEEMAMAIVFAAPCEEVSFRALTMSVFIRAGQDDKDKIKIFKKEISYTELIGFLMSSAFFAILHVNYYGELSLMLTVFWGGMVFAIAYWWTNDLTACILAHFLLNILVVYQNFFMLNL